MDGVPSITANILPAATRNSVKSGNMVDSLPVYSAACPMQIITLQSDQKNLQIVLINNE